MTSSKANWLQAFSHDRREHPVLRNSPLRGLISARLVKCQPLHPIVLFGLMIYVLKRDSHDLNAPLDRGEDIWKIIKATGRLVIRRASGPRAISLLGLNRGQDGHRDGDGGGGSMANRIRFVMF